MKAQTLCSHVRRECKPQFEDKPDMIEANATYLLQKLSSVDAQGSRASGLVSSTNNILADIGVFMPVATFFRARTYPVLFPSSELK